MVGRARLMAIVGVLLIACAVLLLVVGSSGVRAEASRQNKQEHTEASKKEQGSTPRPTASDEPRCGETRTYRRKAEDGLVYTTNDLPGCP